MKQKAHKIAESIDIKSYEDEIKWGIAEIKRSSAENCLVKEHYVLKICTLFSQQIETAAEEIYDKIVRGKKIKKYKFPEPKVKDIIKSETEQLIDKYISLISDNIGGMYAKYHLDEKDIALLRNHAKKICNEQSERYYFKYYEYLKKERREFTTWLFSMVAALTGAIGVVIMLWPHSN